MSSYDPRPALEDLVERARYFIGESGWRMCGVEGEQFIYSAVHGAMLKAYRDAEIERHKDTIRRADEASALLLKSAVAGLKLGREDDKQ